MLWSCFHTSTQVLQHRIRWLIVILLLGTKIAYSARATINLGIGWSYIIFCTVGDAFECAEYQAGFLYPPWHLTPKDRTQVREMTQQSRWSLKADSLQGKRTEAKLGDLGLAKLVPDGQLALLQTLPGTPAYSAPEVMQAQLSWRLRTQGRQDHFRTSVSPLLALISPQACNFKLYCLINPVNPCLPEEMQSVCDHKVT